MTGEKLHKYIWVPIITAFVILISGDTAFAQDVDDIAENIITSSSEIPGLISALSYLLGILLAVTAILRLRDHVENPAQAPLKNAVVRALAAGSLFALPFIFEIMRTAIDGGNISIFSSSNNSPLGFASMIMGGLSNLIPTMNINAILENITDSIKRLPGFITAIAYLTGLLMGVLGILKVKEHVENEQQTPLREGVIRLLIGGALFAIPTVYDAMFNAIEGGGLNFLGNITSILGSASIFFSSETSNIECNPIGIPFIGVFLAGPDNGASVGDAVCTAIRASGALPNFLFAISYLFGLVLGFWGLLKIRDHVLNPQQISISEGITRLLAGGAFFSLPILVEVARNSVTPESLTALSTVTTNTGFNEGASGGGNLFDSILSGDFTNAFMSFFGIGGSNCGPAGGLDVKLSCFMADIYGPITVMLNFFGLVAGIILIMVGISRIIKSTQEGSKGPLGMGTIMTFLTGGALISSNALIRAFSTSFFQSPITFTHANLRYTEGLEAHEIAHVHTVISAILKFVIIVGLISFIRGIIIIRDVAEGKQQATLMAGMTHIIGGALAVNLGPLLNTVQTTLGLTSFGIVFT